MLISLLFFGSGRLPDSILLKMNYLYRKNKAGSPFGSQPKKVRFFLEKNKTGKAECIKI